MPCHRKAGFWGRFPAYSQGQKQTHRLLFRGKKHRYTFILLQRVSLCAAPSQHREAGLEGSFPATAKALLASGSSGRCSLPSRGTTSQGCRLGLTAPGMHALPRTRLAAAALLAAPTAKFHPRLSPKCKFRATPLHSGDPGLVPWEGAEQNLDKETVL